MRVLVTGGHITPALAVIDELIQRDQEVFFVGRRFVNQREKSDSFEYKEIVSRNVPFYYLNSGRLQQSLSFSTLNQIFLFTQAFLKSFTILSNVKPQVIASFGGYIALPVCLSARIKGIPVITHEQTISPGSTNKIISRFAKKVCISFPESAHYFGDKAVITGNPIRGQLLEKPRSHFLSNYNKPIVYVSGGSLGSHSINVLIEKLLPQLLEKYTLIHQTGNIEEFNDYERLLQKKTENYIVTEHISTKDLAWIFQNAAAVVTRSGANTVFELIVFTLPAVLIPLPWAAQNEQMKQAKLLSSHGAVEVFSQNEDPARLLELIDAVVTNKHVYKHKYSELSHYIHLDAAKKITDALLES